MEEPEPQSPQLGLGGPQGLFQPAPAPPLWRDGCLWGLLALGLAIQAYVWLVVLRTTGGQIGAPLDDTYIHLTFARSLLRGQGFSYNPGEPVPGATSPAWVVLLAAAAGSERWLLPASLLLSVLFYLATGMAVGRLARRLELGAAAAFLAGAMTLACGRLIWAGASGMEPCAFAFFSLLAAGAHLRDRRLGGPGPLTALLLGLAAGFRPEGYLLCLIAALDHAIEYDPDKRLFHWTARPYRRRRAVGAAVVLTLLIAPYVGFCLSANGRLFPNTYYVKRNLAFIVPPWIHLRETLKTLVSPRLGFFFLFLAPGILGQMILSYRGTGQRWAALRRARILWLWPVGLTAANTLFNPTNLPHFGRYWIPILPFPILLSVLGLGASAEWLRMALRRQGAERAALYARRALKAAVAASALLALSQIPTWARITGRCVDNINDQQVAIGRWVGQTLPPEASIATHDIGAIAFYGQRRLIDIFGLVTTPVMRILRSDPEMGILGSLPVSEYIRSRRPQYVIAYDNWFSTCAKHPEAFREVFRADLGDKNLICGDALMRVWQADWDRYDPKVDQDSLYGRSYPGYSQGYGAQAAPTTPTTTLRTGD